MMAIVSVLVFMLVQGRAVCDELFPISVLEGFFLNQSAEWPASDYTKSPQVKSIIRPQRVQDILCSKPIGQYVTLESESLKEINPIDWITKCIVDEYDFQENEKGDMWTFQPSFKDDLEKPEFHNIAAEVQEFFQKNNDWAKTIKKYDTNALLMLTAARYLLVTSILYKQSGGRLIVCSKTWTDKGKKYMIPKPTGVCYPVPYGSACYTSDYDVGLIGKESGFLTEKFNEYFQRTFGEPSEFVFDTNVYAYTLEFAMPSIFIGLPLEFGTTLEIIEKKDDAKMQELASAYFKVFKYNEEFFNMLKTDGLKMGDLQKKLDLEKWMNIYHKMNRKVGIRSDSKDFEDNPQLLMRKAHNKEYQNIVESMERKMPYQAALTGDLSKALIYAAEAYHTRGAIRHVVGAIQMKSIDASLKKELSTHDLWVSMIENWGEANKEYHHCEDKTLDQCFLKMSKYMWRVFDAMRLLRKRLPEETKSISFRPNVYPQRIMEKWLKYKKEGRTDFNNDDVESVRLFLEEFECLEVKTLANTKNLRGTKFSLDCLARLNNKVMEYNLLLATLFATQPDKLLRK